MDYFEDEIVEQEVSDAIKLIEIINQLKIKIQELEIIIKEKNNNKIKDKFKEIYKFLE